MGSITVAVLGALDYSNSLGKKSTSTDITLYDLKKGEDIVTFIEPTRYPERLAPLFYATSLARKAILIVDELSPTFGECVVMLQCSNVNGGYIILRNYLTREKIEPLLRGTVLEKFEFIEDNPIPLREKLLAEASQVKPTQGAEGKGTVPVDHAFSVKGVGVVILGVLMKGTVSKHDMMTVHPGKKTTQVRSIQKHDDDFDIAYEGDRVGLALKNVEVEDVERGTVLTTDSAIKSITTIKAKAALAKYWSIPIKSGMVVHIGHWMQFEPGKVEAVTDDSDWRKPTLTITMEKEIAHQPNDRAVIAYLEGGKLRVVGTIELT